MRIDDSTRAMLKAGVARIVECFGIKTALDDDFGSPYEALNPSSNWLRYTTNQSSITIGGATFIAGPVFTGIKGTTTNDLTVNSMTIKISFSDTDTVHGLSWPVAIREGVFDEAVFVWYRAFMVMGDSVDHFAGFEIKDVLYVGDIEVNGVTASFKLSPPTTKLTMSMPWQIYAPYCTHPLWDTNRCLAQVYVPAIAAGVTGAVEAGSSRTSIVWSGAASGYCLGSVKFTSGANRGFRRSISSTGAGLIGLTRPLPFVPAVGDTFLAVEGCDKTMTRCNILHPTTSGATADPAASIKMRVFYGGFPFVPPATTLMG